MNPFVYKTAAQRYAAFRPTLHPRVISLIRTRLSLDAPLEHVLDVACGTGLSCRALRAVARRVVGVDISTAMLSATSETVGVAYLAAAAEQLPFPKETFDLITVSSAFHWFDAPRFLCEANRLLPVNHWLAVYGNEFHGCVMSGHEEFNEWYQQEYLSRFPSPPRHKKDITPAEADAAGFHFAESEHYDCEVDFSRDGLVDYLTTQSNIIVAVEGGDWTLDAVRAWLHAALDSFFDGPTATFVFGGVIWYLQKVRAV